MAAISYRQGRGVAQQVKLNDFTEIDNQMKLIETSVDSLNNKLKSECAKIQRNVGSAGKTQDFEATISVAFKIQNSTRILISTLKELTLEQAISSSTPPLSAIALRDCKYTLYLSQAEISNRILDVYAKSLSFNDFQCNLDEIKDKIITQIALNDFKEIEEKQAQIGAEVAGLKKIFGSNPVSATILDGVMGSATHLIRQYKNIVASIASLSNKSSSAQNIDEVKSTTSDSIESLRLRLDVWKGKQELSQTLKNCLEQIETAKSKAFKNFDINHLKNCLSWDNLSTNCSKKMSLCDFTEIDQNKKMLQASLENLENQMKNNLASSSSQTNNISSNNFESPENRVRNNSLSGSRQANCINPLRSINASLTTLADKLNLLVEKNKILTAKNLSVYLDLFTHKQNLALAQSKILREIKEFSANLAPYRDFAPLQQLPELIMARKGIMSLADSIE
jgi:hypothetical protein